MTGFAEEVKSHIQNGRERASNGFGKRSLREEPGNE